MNWEINRYNNTRDLRELFNVLASLMRVLVQSLVKLIRVNSDYSNDFTNFKSWIISTSRFSEVLISTM